MNNNNKIDLLDYGFVRLIDWMGSDLSVVRSARVSYDAEWRAGEDEDKDEKLIHYLMKNHHTSPSESVTFTFEVKAPIFVFRQWHRHRTWCLSGDTELEFRRSGNKIYKMALRDFYEKWEGGLAQQKGTKRKPTHIERIDDSWVYSVPELAEIVERREEDLRNLVREGKMQCRRMTPDTPNSPSIFIKGSWYKEWANEATRKSPSIKGRLRDMNILMYDEDKKLISTTHITDAIKSEPKLMYLIKVGNRTIKASENHRFLTDSGWLRVKEFSDDTKLAVRDLSNTKQEFDGIDINEAEEVWVPTKHVGYEVSNFGRVRSYYRQGSKNIHSTPVIKSGCGTRNVVSIRKAGIVQISHLVYEGFVGNIEEGKYVCHKNDQTYDNRPCNLYLGTAKDNSDDRKRNGGTLYSSIVFELVNSVSPIGMEDSYDVSVESDFHNFIANGFVTHNSYNEVSARYSELPEEYYLPLAENVTTQSKSNKQMRTAEQHPLAQEFIEQLEDNSIACFALYKEYLEKGIPRELARCALPMNTYSHMFGTVNLHNLFHFLKLRLHEHAQYEIRVYAEAMLQLIEPIVPVSVAAFKKYQLGES